MRLTKDRSLEKYKFASERVEYNPDTGIFTWGSKSRKFAGKIAGSPNTHGYIRIGLTKQTSIGAHRLAWFIYHGEFPDGEIDHLNHNRADNRICNLRLVKKIDNSKNRKMYVTNTSGLPNVYYHKKNKRWLAKCQTKYLGSYATREDAYQVAQKYLTENGFHKNHGAIAVPIEIEE